jgi:long-chain acyl-CoA synthetase
LQVEEFLENSARLYPEKTALVDGERRFTYLELDQQSNRLARAFLSRGVERGDRIVIHLENSAEAVVAIFAALKAGAVFVPAHPSAKAERIGYLLKNCGASMLVTGAEKLGSILESLETKPKATLVDREVLAATGMSSDSLPRRSIDADLAAVIYTSGSTGKPKGVMLTHLNMRTAAESIIAYLENHSDDIILNVLPVSQGYGLYQVLTAFKAGATVILERSFAYPMSIVNTIAREGVTGFPLIPTIAAMLPQVNREELDFSRLRYITSAGAALPLTHLSKLRRIFPQAKLFSMYGLTECQRVSYLPPDQIDSRPGSVGRGMPNEEVFIVDEDGQRVPPGVVGELVIRGSHVMKGYWGMPDETNRVLKPRPFPWENALYSGDLFRADEDGYLYFVARKDDIIKTRGQKVSPREIEEVLHALPGVRHAAAIGIPDDVLGSAVKAIVVLEPGARLSKNDVLRHCAQHLENYMLPQFVEIREEMPMTPSGKIAKKELHAVQEGTWSPSPQIS